LDKRVSAAILAAVLGVAARPAAADVSPVAAMEEVQLSVYGTAARGQPGDQNTRATMFSSQKRLRH